MPMLCRYFGGYNYSGSETLDISYDSSTVIIYIYINTPLGNPPRYIYEFISKGNHVILEKNL
jgi:hypothetical protein